MKKAPKKSGLYIKIAIVLVVVLLGYFFMPTNQNSFSNTYKLRGTSSTGDPIKLQFRNGFQYDKYEPAKKSTFMQKRMEDDKEKKPIFWDKK